MNVNGIGFWHYVVADLVPGGSRVNWIVVTVSRSRAQRLTKSLRKAVLCRCCVRTGIGKPRRVMRGRYPGVRVQMDICKIGPGRYQYTAVDDCTRIRVLALYSRRSGANTLLF